MTVMVRNVETVLTNHRILVVAMAAIVAMVAQVPVAAMAALVAMRAVMDSPRSKDLTGVRTPEGKMEPV